MSLLENAKRFAEKTTGWRRPEDPKLLLRDRKPRTFKFKDDGLIPNHPRWPFVLYKSVVRLPKSLDPAAVFEELFETNRWGNSWRDGIYNYDHYHSRTNEVLGIARGSGKVRFGGSKGRAVRLKAGDVAILPAAAPAASALKPATTSSWSGPTHPQGHTTNAPRSKTAKRLSVRS